LAELERGLAFVAGGHSAGERILVERLAGSPLSQLNAEVGNLPLPGRPPDGMEVRLTGLIVFGPPK
jgi:hypothetical protein